MTTAARVAAAGAVLLLAACVSAREPEIPAGGTVEPVARVGVLVLEGASTADVAAAFEAFATVRSRVRAGSALAAIGRTTAPVQTREGLRLVPDHALGDAPPLDVLVIPGGAGAEAPNLEDLDLIQWVSSRGQRAKHVVGFGRGVFLLAEAGLLRDRSCTLSPADEETFRRQYPHLTVVSNRGFLSDRETLTSPGGIRAREAALHLVGLVHGPEAAAAAARDLGLPDPESPPSGARTTR